MILVTGGTGLIGSHLLYHLVSSGKKVRALRRAGSNTGQVEKVFSWYSPNAKQLAAQVEWVEGDVLDHYSLLEAMEGVNQVYHSAAMISFVPKDAQAMLHVNVQGTANVVNAAIEKKVNKLCHVSSIAALGKMEHSRLIDEQTHWRSSHGNSNYSISKYGAEREAWRGMEEGLSVVVVNPSMVVGPGYGDFGSRKIFDTLRKGLSFYPEGESGWVDVKDVVKAMVQLTEGDAHSERYIITGENATYEKVFGIMADHLGKRRPSIKAGPVLTGLAWRFEKLRSFLTGKPPLVTRETAKGAIQVSRYSNEKIKKKLGIEFIGLEKALQDTCNIFLKEV